LNKSKLSPADCLLSMLIRAWKSPLSYPIREESKFSSSNYSLTPNLFSLWSFSNSILWNFFFVASDWLLYKL
jgi:hypothetical protein